MAEKKETTYQEGIVKVVAKTGGIMLQGSEDWFNPADTIARQQVVPEMKGKTIKLTLAQDNKKVFTEIVVLEKELTSDNLSVKEETIQTDEPTNTVSDKALSSKQFQKHHLVKIGEKQFVTYNGLLALAHKSGLEELRILQSGVDMQQKTAWCIVRAKSKDMIVDGFGSATPENLVSQVAKSFVEMAHTRAKSRALRDLLNVDMCSAEEMR